MATAPAAMTNVAAIAPLLMLLFLLLSSSTFGFLVSLFSRALACATATGFRTTPAIFLLDRHISINRQKTNSQLAVDGMENKLFMIQHEHFRHKLERNSLPDGSRSITSLLPLSTNAWRESICSRSSVPVSHRVAIETILFILLLFHEGKGSETVSIGLFLV